MTSHITYIKNIFGMWLCFGIVFGQEEKLTSLEILVPHIEQQNFKLDSSGQHYTLRIELPDGSTRTENVELQKPNTPDQELIIKGKLRNFYPEGLSMTSYEAGKCGYIVKYIYQSIRVPVTNISPLLSISALKSAAG